MPTINPVLFSCLLAFLMASPAYAENSGHDMEHGGGVYHMFELETGYGASRDHGFAAWDLDGWIGGDMDKLWLKSEGTYADDTLEEAEFQALYSRNIDTFWDLQAGVRLDSQPIRTWYGVVGVQGLAPYFIETEAHLFFSDEGDLTARIHIDNDFMLSQQWVLQPFAEINLAAHDIAEQEKGAGITDISTGIQVRYEISRAFAPFVEIGYERLTGETSAIARHHNEDRDEATVMAGSRFVF